MESSKINQRGIETKQQSLIAGISELNLLLNCEPHIYVVSYYHGNNMVSMATFHIVDEFLPLYLPTFVHWLCITSRTPCTLTGFKRKRMLVKLLSVLSWFPWQQVITLFKNLINYEKNI
jgi:hypothetical protein